MPSYAELIEERYGPVARVVRAEAEEDQRFEPLHKDAFARARNCERCESDFDRYRIAIVADTGTDASRSPRLCFECAFLAALDDGWYGRIAFEHAMSAAHELFGEQS